MISKVDFDYSFNPTAGKITYGWSK